MLGSTKVRKFDLSYAERKSHPVCDLMRSHVRELLEVEDLGDKALVRARTENFVSFPKRPKIVQMSQDMQGVVQRRNSGVDKVLRSCLEVMERLKRTSFSRARLGTRHASTFSLSNQKRGWFLLMDAQNWG